MEGSDERWLICSDFNGHHPAWDGRVSANARGTHVLDCSGGCNLVLINDASVTHVGSGTVCALAPDVTFCLLQAFETLQWGTKGIWVGSFSNLDLEMKEEDVFRNKVWHGTGSGRFTWRRLERVWKLWIRGG